MEENLQNNDNLESFFKNSFERGDYSSPTGDWDTPADSLWDKIEEELPKESPSKLIYIPRLIAVLAAMLLFLFGGISLFLYLQNSNLSHVIEQQKQIVRDASKDRENGTEHQLLQKKTNATARYNPDATPPLTPSGRKNYLSESIGQQAPSAVIEDDINGIITDKNATTPAQTVEPVNRIAVAPVATINVTIPDHSLDLDLTRPLIEEKKEQSGFFVGVFVAPSYSGKKVIPNSPDSSLPFRGQEMTTMAANWGIKGGFHLNRNWDILSGLSMVNAAQVQHRRLAFNHEPANEHQENNEYVSSYSLSISSSLGESDAAVEVARPDNHPLSDRRLPIAVTLKQKVSFLNIPLLVKYNKKIGRFRVSASGGVSLNFLSRLETKLQVRSLRHNFNIRPIRTMQFPSIDNKTSINFVAGIGLAYDIDNHLSLSIEPQLQKNVRPFIKNSDFQSSLYVTGVQLGAYWNF